jgi:hypothetical protein
MLTLLCLDGRQTLYNDKLDILKIRSFVSGWLEVHNSRVLLLHGGSSLDGRELADLVSSTCVHVVVTAPTYESKLADLYFEARDLRHKLWRLEINKQLWSSVLAQVLDYFELCMQADLVFSLALKRTGKFVLYNFRVAKALYCVHT